ncbi:FHA domain-containing protein [Permianibacter sp. IMCC34836]|uniref:type VI secretion system-associated FHA domain protein n=1 Tax=Permianibacter fluminis TaxID=2738515 RepID=UPI001554DD7E|nr:type VI secretion system-associated FHA domain protein [Permianibacter fluminis]NQD35858.1 FHA domain-containing protein [Permianibacter fluminis]
MELVFEAVQGPFAGGASAGSVLARFDGSGGIIGRSPECQLVLDDPERTVSRQHAGIRRRGDQFVLEVLSQVNPVLVNGEPCAHGQTAVLNDGDTLAIGPFSVKLKVIVAAPAAVPAVKAETSASADAGSADSQRALQMLSQGLGFPLRANSSAEAEEKLRLYGEMLAEALEGLRRLMLQRAESKSELVPANRTIVVATDKNPIKHAGTRQEMMSLMFSSEAIAAGIVDPVGAVRDAMTDIRQHEAAMLTGLHGAVDGALKRLSPSAIEKETSGGFLPALRKAALWDHYCSRHGELGADMMKSGSTGIWDDFKHSYNEEIARQKARK